MKPDRTRPIVFNDRRSQQCGGTRNVATTKEAACPGTSIGTGCKRLEHTAITVSQLTLFIQYQILRIIKIRMDKVIFDIE